MLGRFGAAALTGLLLFIPSGGAVAADQTPRSLDDLVATYGVGDVPADVLTVVDTSSSMGQDGNPPPWPYVQKGWSDLVDAVRPQDRVGLVTFDKVATTKLDLAPLPNKADRAAAKQKLADQPEGKATDIGAGIQAALKRLEAPGASEIQTLIFITDGVHNPGPNSVYPKRSGAAWEDLKRRGRALIASRQGRLSVYGWAAGSATTDIDLLQSVFPTAEIVDLPPRRIGPFLESAALGLQRERVRPLVQADLKVPIRAQFRPEGTLKLKPVMDGTVVLRNDRKGLPTQVDVKSLSLTEADGTPVPLDLKAEKLTIAPGAQAEIPVTIRPAGAEHSPKVGNYVDARDWQVSLEAPTSLSPRLTELLSVEMLAQARDTRGEVATAGELTAEDHYGIEWKYAIGVGILALLVLIALALFLKWMFIKPKLVGVLLRKTDDNEWTQVKRLRGKTLDVPGRWLVGVEGDHSIRLVTRVRTRPGTVFAQRTGGQPRINGAVLGNRPQRLAGQNQLSLGDEVQLRYEKRSVTK